MNEDMEAMLRLRTWVQSRLQPLINEIEDHVVEGDVPDDDVAEVLSSVDLGEAWKQHIKE